MTLKESRRKLSISGKNGVGFLLAGLVIWIITTGIFLTSLPLIQKNIYMLFTTGLMFPLSILISKLIKADWKFDQQPLGKLGMYLNLAQFMYFPILAWAFQHTPAQVVAFFAVITGAHFFPYGWLYDTKAYLIFAPIISISVIIISWNIGTHQLWLIPLFMSISLSVLIYFLLVDYRKKVQ